MPIEQRVVSDKKIGGGKIGGGKGAPEEEADGGKAKKKLNPLLLVIVVLVLVIVGGAAYFLVLAPSGDDTATEEVVVEETVAPELGEIISLDAISVNLAEGHYLRIGVAVQLTAAAAELLPAPDTTVVADAVIELYSGEDIDAVNDPAHRAELKALLLERLNEAFADNAYEVYFTTYVTQ